MAETESYVTKQNPTVEDWLLYNENYFLSLRGESIEGEAPYYAPLADVDSYAAEAGVSTEEYFEQIKGRVGSLGRATLRLVHSDMDDARHIVIAPEQQQINS